MDQSKPAAKTPTMKTPTIAELAAKPLSPEHQAIVEQICELVADGGNLAEIARMPEMPPARTIRRLLTHPSIAALYARARDQWADVEADAIVDYAMQPLSGNEDANLRRTRLDTRKWRLAKQSPRKYGDRLEVSGLGDALSGVVVNMVLTPRQPNAVLEPHQDDIVALPEAGAPEDGSESS